MKLYKEPQHLVPLAVLTQGVSGDLKHSGNLYIYFSVITISWSQKTPSKPTQPQDQLLELHF